MMDKKYCLFSFFFDLCYANCDALAYQKNPEKLKLKQGTNIKYIMHLFPTTKGRTIYVLIVAAVMETFLLIKVCAQCFRCLKH